jgi:Raf kinase inhibitor-like YbhB/YbcL family protein
LRTDSFARVVALKEATMAKLHLGNLTISSPAFEHGGRIPADHTTEGADVSPELTWAALPEGTVELALLCHDPDAPLTMGFTHWVVYGIPPDATGIPQGGGGAFTEGTNDFGNTGYGGPAPPPGHGTHHYFFHLYALGAPLEAGPGLTGLELLQRIDEHIIEQARIVGTYSR